MHELISENMFVNKIPMSLPESYVHFLPAWGSDVNKTKGRLISLIVVESAKPKREMRSPRKKRPHNKGKFPGKCFSKNFPNQNTSLLIKGSATLAVRTLDGEHPATVTVNELSDARELKENLKMAGKHR